MDAEISRHERLAPVVVPLLENLIRQKNIEFLSITGRVKSIDSLKEKIQRKGYDSPKDQITDITGIRVITYLESHVRQISDIIRECFKIDEINSDDKTNDLGNDKVGYRSVHFVCTLGQQREKLAEYKEISSLKFEIQVRTVLQHAWAELSHDNAFKLKTSLPADLQRKLNLHAGMLEVVDKAFQEIFESVEIYKTSLSNSSDTALEKAELNLISLEALCESISEKNNISFRNNLDDEIIDELRSFGIKNIDELQKLITQDYIEKYSNSKLKLKTKNTNLGFIRGAMMYSDINKYFSIHTRWKGLNRTTIDILKHKYEEDEIAKIAKRAGKSIVD